jgi:transcriptional regulator with GAF, ATPase, and Fis domain
MLYKDSGADEDLLKGTVADFEKHIIVSALERSAGNQSLAARQLGTTLRVFSSRIRKYGSDPARLCWEKRGRIPS